MKKPAPKVRAAADAAGGAPRHWLVKSEPDVFSFDDLWRAPRRTTPWDGVRNAEARNSMRDLMRVGDPVFFYHSSCDEPGVVGLAEVASAPYPDATQFDAASPYFDPTSDRADPRWILVDVRATARLRQPVLLPALRADPRLAGMVLLRKGSRLSVVPVEPEHARVVLQLAGIE
jgi:predicted RNA-binding protein with PUA-like domain